MFGIGHFKQHELEQFYVTVRAYFPEATVLPLDNTVGSCRFVDRKDVQYEADVSKQYGNVRYTIWKREYTSCGWFTSLIFETSVPERLASELRDFTVMFERGRQ